MLFEKKEPIIFLIAGKARSGKNTVGKIIEEYYKKQNKKVIISQYTKYLKMYIENIINRTIDDNNKPRELLQKLSSELIKKELKNHNFFINRQIEDIDFYSYFADIIIISDVRFKEEITSIKEKYQKVVSIGVIRPDYQSDLTYNEQNDITEISLDNYNEYDYKIINTNSNKLNIDTIEILNNLKKEGIK